jgi:Tfp pilus assembly protein PilO
MLVQGENNEVKMAFLKKMPREKLQQVVFVCIVTLAAVVGVVEFYVLKNWTELTETEASITKLADQIREGERQARGAQQDVAHRAEVKSFVEAQQAVMVSGDPFAWVVREISLLAEQHPVRVTALHPGIKSDTTAESKGRTTYTTGIDVAGTYDQIGAFVQDLENKFSTAEIRSVTVNGSADDKGQHGATLTMTLRVLPPEPSKKTEAKKST